MDHICLQGSLVYDLVTYNAPICGQRQKEVSGVGATLSREVSSWVYPFTHSEPPREYAVRQGCKMT